MSTLQKETHWDRTLTCYAARPANANDMLARTIALSADNEAVVDGAVRLRYRELAAALAANLSARGVGKGERVAVMLANRVEAVLSVIAIARIGAIVVPIGTRLRRPEITYIFDDAQPIAVIHGEEFAGELPDTGPAHAMRFACGSVAWNALLEAGTPAAPPVDVAEEDVFGILYTSVYVGHHRPAQGRNAHAPERRPLRTALGRRPPDDAQRAHGSLRPVVARLRTLRRRDAVPAHRRDAGADGGIQAPRLSGARAERTYHARAAGAGDVRAMSARTRRRSPAGTGSPATSARSMRRVTYGSPIARRT